VTISELTLEISKLPIADRLSLLEIIAKSLRDEVLTSQDDFNELLKKTQGSWRGPDGLKYQEQSRSEWENR